VFAAAQDTTTAPKDDAVKAEKREHRGMGKREGKMGRHGRHGMRGLAGIELTDAQKEQFRAIHEANKPDAAAREEMKTLATAKRSGTLTPDQTERFKQLKAQGREKAQAVKLQIDGILTPEQKAQIETKKQEMRQKMQERRQQKKAAQPATPVDN